MTTLGGECFQNLHSFTWQGVALAKKHDGVLDLPAVLAVTAFVMRMPVTVPVPAFGTDVATPVPLRVARLLPPLRAPPV